MRAPQPLDAMLEKDWDAQLFNSQRGLATSLGWSLCYHTLRSKGSRSGFPDRVLIRDRVIFAELKREKTKPTDEQVKWLDGLSHAGAEVYLWRPSDLDEIGRVLSRRWVRLPDEEGLGMPSDEIQGMIEMWTPDSFWVAGVGRADS